MKLLIVTVMLVAALTGFADGATTVLGDQRLGEIEAEQASLQRSKRDLEDYCPFPPGFRIVTSPVLHQREPTCSEKCVSHRHWGGYCSGGFCICQDGGWNG